VSNDVLFRGYEFVRFKYYFLSKEEMVKNILKIDGLTKSKNMIVFEEPLENQEE
jgi:hypothetical protein